jgi:hypothetical protein
MLRPTVTNGQPWNSHYEANPEPNWTISTAIDCVKMSHRGAGRNHRTDGARASPGGVNNSAAGGGGAGRNGSNNHQPSSVPVTPATPATPVSNGRGNSRGGGGRGVSRGGGGRGRGRGNSSSSSAGSSNHPSAVNTPVNNRHHGGSQHVSASNTPMNPRTPVDSSPTGDSRGATLTNIHTGKKINVSYFANAGRKTRGKKQNDDTKKGYMGKLAQMVLYLFNRAHGLYALEEGEENNVEEYLEFYDESKTYSPGDEDSWSIVTTVNENEEVMEHKVRMVLPMKLKYFVEIFGYLCVNPKLAGVGRRGKKKEIIVLPGVGEGQMVEGEYEAPPLAAVDEEEVDADDIPTMSASNMGGYKSALVWYIKTVRHLDVKSWEQYQPADGSTSEFNTNQSLDSILDQIINGYKKTVADKKRRGVMSATEGKSCITNTGFTELVRGCRKICEVENPTANNYNASIFAAAWILLQWNLVSRSVSVEDLLLEHLDWSGDAMRIHFAKSKSDQTGEGFSNEKNVYANPVFPELCVVTALAVFFFSTPRTASKPRGGTHTLKDTKLFPGTSQKSRWRDILAENILPNVDTVALGCATKDGKFLNVVVDLLLFRFIYFIFFYSRYSLYSKRGWYIFAVFN